MKHLFFKTLACSSLLFLTLTANAQNPRPPYPERSEEGQLDREAQDNNRVFDRTRNDLNQIQADTAPFSSDRSRVTVAIQQMSECQRAVNAGSYDRRSFSETIAAIQRVMDLNRLNDQSRAYITDDIRELNNLQSRLEGY